MSRSHPRCCGRHRREFFATLPPATAKAPPPTPRQSSRCRAAFFPGPTDRNVTFPPSVLRTPPPGVFRHAATGHSEGTTTNTSSIVPLPGSLLPRTNRLPSAPVKDLPYENAPEENPSEPGSFEPLLLRLSVLWLLALC